MQAKIQEIPARKIVGMCTQMSLTENTTRALWQQFMPRRKEIANKSNANFYSLQRYDENLAMQDFRPTTIFEKWAAVEVDDFEAIPEGMDRYLIEGGKYAVFTHHGAANTFHKTFQYIFATWLPNSDFQLDQRAHFEIMGADYRADDPNAQEEVWIPIKNSMG